MPICSALACGSCRRLVADLLCMPWTERIRASRMRETCTSGLKRAEAAGYTAPPLLDWLITNFIRDHHLWLHSSVSLKTSSAMSRNGRP